MTARKGASDYYWLKDLKKNPEMLKPPEIIIPRLMWRGARVCLFGREKSGKSTLLTYAVAQASNGLTFLDEQCQQATFVWCALEEMISETVRRFEKFGGDGSRRQVCLSVLVSAWAA
jgi:RecA-family ATPase